MRTLILAAILVGLVAVAKDPNAGIKSNNKSNAQGSETNRQHDTAATSTVTATTTSQQVPNREASGVDTKAPHHDTHPPNSGPEQKPWFDSQFWFNLLLVIFTGLLAFLAYRQLRAMHRQADLMSGQLAEMKTTGADTHTFALAAQAAADAAKEQAAASNAAAMFADHTATSAMHQTEAMLVQAQALILSAGAAKDSVAITRQQVEAYDRPWIKASFVIDGMLEYGAEGAALRLRCVLENVGRSVANEVSVDGVLIVPTYGDGSSFKEQLRIVRRPPIDGSAVFPGEKPSFPVYASITKDELARGIFPVGEEHEGINLRFLGVVFYRFLGSEVDHTTGIVYSVGRPTERDPNGFDLALTGRGQFAD
jgi:hypothetical protein